MAKKIRRLAGGCVGLGCASVLGLMSAKADFGFSPFHFVGQVKAITVDRGDVKVKMANSSGRSELFRVCNEKSVNENDPFYQHKVEFIRQAFKTGHPIRMNTRNLFDRCVTTTEVVSYQ
jgi:hypothetical protein